MLEAAVAVSGRWGGASTKGGQVCLLKGAFFQRMVAEADVVGVDERETTRCDVPALYLLFSLPKSDQGRIMGERVRWVLPVACCLLGFLERWLGTETGNGSR